MLQKRENKCNLKIYWLQSLQWRQESTNGSALLPSLALESTNLQKVNWNQEGSAGRVLEDRTKVLAFSPQLHGREMVIALGKASEETRKHAGVAERRSIKQNVDTDL